jgi:GT2 family glycosyltransferase
VAARRLCVRGTPWFDSGAQAGGRRRTRRGRGQHERWPGPPAKSSGSGVLAAGAPSGSRPGYASAVPGGSALPVYLIHWNEPAWCAAASESVLASSGANIELTVVDNGQIAGPPLSSCLPTAVRVLPMARNTGYTGGANAALRDWRDHHPDEEFVVIGSHDLHVLPDTLVRLLAVAKRYPQAGVVAPALIAPHPAAGGVWNGRRSWQVSPPATNEIVERDWASGACLLLRRACVEDVGDFDESLGSYEEDVDYGLRARDHGWTVLIDPGAHAWGLGTSSGSSVEQIAANTVLLSAKRRGARGAAASLTVFVGWALKGWIASVLPWRAADRRALSRRYSRGRTVGLYRLLTSRRLARVLHERHRG